MQMHAPMTFATAISIFMLLLAVPYARAEAAVTAHESHVDIKDGHLSKTSSQESAPPPGYDLFEKPKSKGGDGDPVPAPPGPARKKPPLKRAKTMPAKSPSGKLASDDDDEEEPDEVPAPPGPPQKKPESGKPASDDDEETDDEVPAPPGPPQKKPESGKPASDDDEETDDEVPAPPGPPQKKPESGKLASDDDEETDDEAPKESNGEESTSTCNTDLDIYKGVLGGNVSQFFKKTPGVVDLKLIGNDLPRGCRDWSKKDNCCNLKYFKQQSKMAGAEKRPLQVVRDHYANFHKDVVGPTLKSLDGGNPAAVKILKELKGAPAFKTVADYIDNCEDGLRLFFATTRCKLCSPDLGAQITENKYLPVSADNCSKLHGQCREMPEKLEEAGKQLIVFRNKLNKSAPGMSDPAAEAGKANWLLRTWSWLDRAGRLLQEGSQRISFYASEKDFCEKLQKVGFVYQPFNWGNVLLLHVSSLAPPEERTNWLEERENPTQDELETTQSLADSLDSDASASSMLETGSSTKDRKVHRLRKGDDDDDDDDKPDDKPKKKDIKCIHGEQVGDRCICEGCWVGSKCDIEKPSGPFDDQLFEPLVADVTVGSKKTLTVVGCNMPTDLRHQLARIKLVQQASDEDDPYPCKKNDKSSLKEHIPLSVTEGDYVYQVDVPQEQGLYHVCSCIGVDCVQNIRKWRLLGPVEVLRTPQEVGELKAKILSVDYLRDYHKKHAPRVLDGSCEEVVPEFNDEILTFEVNRCEGGKRVGFKCKDGYNTLAGVTELACFKSQWVVQGRSSWRLNQKKPSLSQSEPWYRDWPACMSDHNGKCGEPRGIRYDKGQVMQAIEAFTGDVRYQCQDASFGARLVLRGNIGELQPDDLVWYKGKVGQIVSFDGASRQYSVQTLAPENAPANATENFTLHQSDAAVIAASGFFKQTCQDNGKWVPQQVDLQCPKVSAELNQEEAEIANDMLAISQGKDSKQGKASSSSLLEEAAFSHSGNDASQSGQGQQKVRPVRGHLGELYFRSWPIVLSRETDKVAYVDECLISHLNCSDGSVAKDTALARLPQSIDLSLLEEEDIPWWSSKLMLTGCLALPALLAASMLLAKSRQEQEAKMK
eukprot:TRINITY_DN15278_c0_g1_i1.p1 TRINITY_DN15278_c0_g1~~TRINITY_DN15278_c0_g1_i1.p1  ORF type:complete len:1108 (+),score=265.15 TRINITY_DN15278_c0_g1_i1:73-3396(+)